MNLERDKVYYRENVLPKFTTGCLGNHWRCQSGQSLNKDDLSDAASVKSASSSVSFRTWKKLQTGKHSKEYLKKTRSLCGDGNTITEIQPLTFQLTKYEILCYD